MIAAWLLLLTIIALAFLIPVVGFKDIGKDDIVGNGREDGDKLTFI